MGVIITARFGDIAVRVIAPFSTAVQRGRELRQLGWDVELTDEAGNHVRWPDSVESK